MDALTPDLELRLRTERDVAELKVALETVKDERDRWRTIAERRLSSDRQTESPLTRSEMRDWWWRLSA